MKASERAPNAREWIDDRSASAPTDEQLQVAVDSFADYIVARRKRLGLQQQELAECSGLTPGHMSNIERKRGSITLETFLRIAHGLGMQPSELAKFLDGPGSISNTTIRSDIVPVIAVGAVNRKTIEDATAEADSVRAIRSKRDAKLGGANAKIAGSKKDRNR